MKINRVMWALAGAVALAAAMAACGPNTKSAGSSSQTPGGFGLFPTQRVSFKADYKISGGSDETARTMTMYASGGKMRVDMPALANGAMRPVALIDRDAKQFLSFMEGPNAPKRATKMSADQIKRFDEMAPQEAADMKPVKVGSDTVAGLSCTVWRLTGKFEQEDIANASDPAAEANRQQVCVTSDGIMLRAGSADDPRLIATSVEKGPQDASLFALPPGYEVIDLGDCMEVMRAYGASMRNGGAAPDQAKIAECQKKFMSMGAP